MKRTTFGLRSALGILCLSFGTLGAQADMLPDPDQILNPCHNKSEGDSCSTSIRSSRTGTCTWTNVGGAGPEYMTRKAIARYECTVVSKEGENLRARCLMCNESTGSEITIPTPSSTKPH